MRRKEEASKIKQTTRQSNTAHPRQSLLYMCERKESEGEGRGVQEQTKITSLIHYTLHVKCTIHRPERRKE